MDLIAIKEAVVFPDEIFVWIVDKNNALNIFPDTFPEYVKTAEYEANYYVVVCDEKNNSVKFHSIDEGEEMSELQMKVITKLSHPMIAERATLTEFMNILKKDFPKDVLDSEVIELVGRHLDGLLDYVTEILPIDKY